MHATSGSSRSTPRQRLLAPPGNDSRTWRRRLGEYTHELSTLLAPLEALIDSQAAASRDTYLGTGVRAPLAPTLLGYAPNIHRDWAWGTDENQQTAALVLEQLPQAARDCLVIGCGAGRLTYDLHAARDVGVTLGVDINPLLVLIAERLARGRVGLAPRVSAGTAYGTRLRRCAHPERARTRTQRLVLGAGRCIAPARTQRGIRRGGHAMVCRRSTCVPAHPRAARQSDAASGRLLDQHGIPGLPERRSGIASQRR